MSFLLRPMRKISWLLPFCIRRQALTVTHLLLYSSLLVACLILYHWPHPADLGPQTHLRDALPPCSDGHSNGCIDAQRHGREEGTGGAAPLPGARITEVVHINATVKATPAAAVEEDHVEPKNWKGQGYQPIPTNRGSLRHCKQCALVTSSGHLSGKGAGAEIDRSECVIRMNAAPTLNYTRDVGSRTTFRVVGHRNFPRMFDTEEERRLYFVNSVTKSEAIVVLWLYSVNVNRNLELILARKFSQKYKNITFYMTKQEIMNRNVELFYQELRVSRTKGRLWMSTGWVAMLFALEVCDSIDVYGMIYDDYCKEHPNDNTYYHYFDKVQKECSYYERSEKRIMSGHKFMTEKVAFARWAAKYDIKFHLPSWENHQYDPNVHKETVFQKAYMQYRERMGDKSKDSPDAKDAGNNAAPRVDRKEAERTKSDAVGPAADLVHVPQAAESGRTGNDGKDAGSKVNGGVGNGGKEDVVADKEGDHKEEERKERQEEDKAKEEEEVEEQEKGREMDADLIEEKIAE